MYKILVADDEKPMLTVLEGLFKKEGYSVLTATDGKVALKIYEDNKDKIDICLFDVMMPYVDGISLCKIVKEDNENIPVIIMTGRDTEDCQLSGFDNGADDYIAKPYSPSELLARVRSQIRRYLRFGSQNMQKDGEEIIQNGSLELNVTQKQLYVDGEAVKLTSKEYKIINYLMHNLGRIFSAEEIYEHIWQEEAFSVENTVMVHIRRIREKIEINPSDPKYLKVVWGIGYKMEKYN